MSGPSHGRESAFRSLPSVDDVLREPGVASLGERCGRGGLRELVRAALEAWRAEIAAGALDGEGVRRRLERGELAGAVAALVAGEERAGIERAVNATGVVLHTGLGRAPVHPAAARAMAAAAEGYCVLEVDRATGERTRRDERAGALAALLAGAEAGLVVNNNAAAVLLVLSTFAAGRETVVSRGELVEIGGSFRMPDVMERAGTRLVEVGTTNRTRLADFERALTPRTGLLLRVHPSNFRVEGFTETPDDAALCALGAARGVRTAHDLGSGLLDEGGVPAELAAEPRVRAAVRAGFDAVTFSGDKLLGGPQAGLVVGRADAVRALRANPLYRALRCDKVTLAGLEATLALYRAGRADELPARAALLAGAEELARRARALAALLARLPGVTAEVVPGESRPGSGSAPGAALPTSVVRAARAGLSAGELAARLRGARPPVFARVHEGALLLDPRALLPGDADAVAAAFASLRA